MAKIGLYIELKNGQLKKSNLELLTLARKSGGELYAVIFANDLAAYLPHLSGVQTIIQVKAESLSYQPDHYAETLFEIIKAQGLSDFIAAHSAQGKDLLPRVAAKLKAPMVSDCTSVDLLAQRAIKPIYAGKLHAEYHLQGVIRLYTIRPNTIPVEKADTAASPHIESVNLVSRLAKTRIIEILKSENEQKVDLTEAEIIVSGGRGMKAKENFALLRDLAKVLNAGVGASRAAVDAGFATTDMQVGQTGKVVNPKLYVACGISGAIQHFVGMKTAKVIVAINKDPEAPIFKKADYGIVADLFAAVPLLREELNKAAT